MLAISPEDPDDGPTIEALLDRAFGPDRRRKTSYRYRVGIPPLAELCLVAREAGRLVGAIRYWPVRLGWHRPALLLGPLAIEPDRQGQGIGRALTRASLAKAEALGWRLVFLVGEPAYYARHGFAPAPGAVVMPGEDPARLQFMALAGAALPPEGGVLLRDPGGHRGRGGVGDGVEVGEQRAARGRDALVSGHALLHLADPRGHGRGDPGLARHPVEPPDQGADGEHDRPGRRQPAQRLPLDPEPQELPGVLGREARQGLARLRVE
jgi:predicted N-acetyltransferase YhbS